MQKGILSLDHLELRILDYLKHKYKSDFTIVSITPVKSSEALGEFQAIVEDETGETFKIHIRRDGERIRDNLPLKDFNKEVDEIIDEILLKRLKRSYDLKSEILLPYEIPTVAVDETMSLNDFLESERASVSLTLSISQEDKDALVSTLEEMRRHFPRMTINLYYDGESVAKIDGLMDGDFIVLDKGIFTEDKERG